MSQKTTDATNELARVKRIYQQGLKQVDGMLATAVAQNSSDLSTARSIQATYNTGITKDRLMPTLQDPGTATDLLMLADGPPVGVLA